MRTIIMSTCAAVLGAAGLIASAGTTPAAAAPQYAWCQRSPTSGFEASCTFSSYGQCMATISGVGGDCIQNPYLAFGQASEPRPRKGRAMYRQPYDDGGWNQRW